MKNASYFLVLLISVFLGCNKKGAVTCGTWVEGPPDCTTEIRSKYIGAYKGVLTWESVDYDTTISIVAGPDLSQLKWDQTVFQLQHATVGDFAIKETPIGGYSLFSGSLGDFSDGNKLSFTILLKDAESKMHYVIFSGAK